MSRPIEKNHVETMLVAGALINPPLAAEAASYVTSDDFEDQRLAVIWRAIVAMIDGGAKTDEIDPSSVAARCAKGAKTRHEIAMFCGELLDENPRVSSLVRLAQTIHRRRTMALALVQMREMAVEIKSQLSAKDGDFEELDSRLAQLSVAISARSDHVTRRTVYGDLAREVSRYFDDMEGASSSRHIPTGLLRLDMRLGGGLRPGQLHAILGCTGFGKTALASQFCDHAASLGHRAILFSMEVDPVDIYIRDVERTSGRSRWDLRSRHIATRENARSDIMAAQLSVINRACAGKVVYGEPMSLEGIRQSILTERLRSGNIDLIAVDHAQVAEPSATERRGMPRYLEVKAIAEGLRAIGRQLGVSVVLTAQLNPPPKGEKVNMSMVREGKDIVNCAEVVIVIDHEKEEMPDGRVHIMKSSLLVGKARAGQEGRVPVRYRGDCYRFENTDPDEEDD